MLAAIKQGDEHALKRIYSEYRTPFIQWITSTYALQTEEAKDVFQHAVVILYDNVATGKLTQMQSSMKTYLFGIGKNLAHETLRRQQKFAESPSPDLLKHVVETSGRADKEQFEEDLRNAMRGLNLMGDPCKSILQLFYFERQSMESICTLMGYKNAKTVKVKKFKCLQRLRQYVTEEIIREVR